MLLADYVALQCAQHNVRRGHLPAALGLGNANKALRRLNALCAGRSPDADLLQRLRQCPLFEPAAIDAAMAATAAAARILHAAHVAHRQVRLRQQFLPHLWVEHRPGRPDCSIACVAVAGLDHFKRVDIPPHVLDIDAIALRLAALTLFIQELPRDIATWRRLNTGFGPPLFFHYRNAFDRYYSYDCGHLCWSAEHKGQPPIPRVSLQRRSSSSSSFIVHV